MVNLESARTAAPGETVVGARGAAHAAVFEAGAAVGSAGVRRGIADGVELDGEVTYLRVMDDAHRDIDRNVYAGRAGFKMSESRGVAAVLGGVGGGVSPAAGGFVAADLGGAVSYPNCLAVPFAGGSVFASQPVAAKRVDFRRADGSIEAYDTANTTFGFGAGVGVEVPLDHDRCRSGLTPARIQLGVSLNVLRPTDGEQRLAPGDMTPSLTTQAKTYAAFGLAAGVEFPF
jgi:hypothetical protein